MSAKQKQAALLAHCVAFIKDNDISCAEAVHQCDRVIENAYEFIEGICNIVGYNEGHEDDDSGL